MGTKSELKNYGDTTVNTNGQVTIPAEARRDMGFEPATRVIFFGRPDSCELIVMPAPPAEEHLAFVAEQSKRRSKPRSSSG